MILFRSSAGEEYIELHTDGDAYWFIEWWYSGDQMSRDKSIRHNPHEIISTTARNGWMQWHSRPWLAPMLEFMVDHFGEDLFTLVALENL